VSEEFDNPKGVAVLSVYNSPCIEIWALIRLYLRI